MPLQAAEDGKHTGTELVGNNDVKTTIKHDYKTMIKYVTGSCNSAMYCLSVVWYLTSVQLLSVMHC